MKSLHPLFIRTFLVILASLALCAACSTDPTTGSQDSSAVSADGGSTNNRLVSITTLDGGSTTIELDKFQALIVLKGKTPDGKPATFEVGGGYKFENVTEFTYQGYVTLLSYDSFVEGGHDYTVTVTRPNYLFAPWTIHATGDKVHPTVPVEYVHEWGAKAFSLAVDGKYESIDKTDSGTFKTIVQKDEVVLHGIGATKQDPPMVAYNKWYYEDDEAVLSGTITDDLSSITYYLKAKVSGKEWTTALLKK